MKKNRKRKKILITGGTGLLGLALIKQAPKNFDITATYYHLSATELPDFSNCKYYQLDITNKKEIQKLFRVMRPNFLIHTASNGNVDSCEKNKKEAHLINVLASRYLISACKNFNTKIIFTSSNAVFDGTKPPYKENDKTHPLEYYGQTKLQTEKDIIKSKVKYCIVRIMTMFGWNHPKERPNPVTWLIEELKNNRQVNIVKDIYNNHLYVNDAAKAIWQIVKKNKHGIYHIGGPKSISRYDLSLMVAKIFNFDPKLIIPVDSSFFPSLAPRPKNTTYSIKKMVTSLSIKPKNPLQALKEMQKTIPNLYVQK